MVLKKAGISAGMCSCQNLRILHL